MSNLPDAMRRRNILYGDDSKPAELIRLGESYLEEGLLLDALEFFARAEHEDGIETIRTRAVRDGDAFLGLRLVQLGLAPLDAARWKELAASAASKGLDRYAAMALEQAGEPAPGDENGA